MAQSKSCLSSAGNYLRSYTSFVVFVEIAMFGAVNAAHFGKDSHLHWPSDVSGTVDGRLLAYINIFLVSGVVTNFGIRMRDQCHYNDTTREIKNHQAWTVLGAFVGLVLSLPATFAATKKDSWTIPEFYYEKSEAVSLAVISVGFPLLLLMVGSCFKFFCCYEKMPTRQRAIERSAAADANVNGGGQQHSRRYRPNAKERAAARGGLSRNVAGLVAGRRDLEESFVHQPAPGSDGEEGSPRKGRRGEEGSQLPNHGAL